MLLDCKIVPVQCADSVDQLFDQTLSEVYQLFCLIGQVLQFINYFGFQIKELLLDAYTRRRILTLAIYTEKFKTTRNGIYLC